MQKVVFFFFFFPSNPVTLPTFRHWWPFWSRKIKYRFILNISPAPPQEESNMRQSVPAAEPSPWGRQGPPPAGHDLTLSRTGQTAHPTAPLCEPDSVGAPIAVPPLLLCHSCGWKRHWNCGTGPAGKEHLVRLQSNTAQHHDDWYKET